MKFLYCFRATLAEITHLVKMGAGISTMVYLGEVFDLVRLLGVKH
jgi:hypothetical protein